jgi:HSF-type DNA-binding
LIYMLTLVSPSQRYGFHKVNKTPRGQRGALDNQAWEFNHPLFQRGRPDLLDKIRRKSLETELPKTVPAAAPGTPSLQNHLDMMTHQQGEIAQVLCTVQDGYEGLYREVVEGRRRQDALIQLVGQLWRLVDQSGSPSAFPAN